MTFTPEVWDGVVRRLRLELPAFICHAFIENLKVETSAAGLRISCPTAFHRDRVRDQYKANLVECLAAEMGHLVQVEIGIAGEKSVCQGPRGPAQSPTHSPTQIATISDRTPVAADGRDRGRAESVGSFASNGQARRAQAAARPASVEQRPLARPVQRPLLRPEHSFESFVVGPCNALAREASLALVREQDPQLGQLYLCSPSGLGKTHLARAVCKEARASGRRPVYMSAEAFTNEFLTSLRTHQTARFKRKFRQDCDLLVVEDVAFLQGKESTQLEFFHTIQHLCDAGGRVVFTGTRLPQALTALDPRVRSQLAAGFVAELCAPDAQVRRAILRAKAAAGGVHLPEESLEMLVDAVRGSVRDLENVLIQLVTTASLLKKRIDRGLTQEALDKKGAEGAGSLPRLEIAEVVRFVAASFKTSAEELAGKSRRKEVLVPRQLAMYLSRRYTDASLAEIGRALGRDHPSVRNAIDKIERAVLEKVPLRYQVEELARQLDERSRT